MANISRFEPVPRFDSFETLWETPVGDLLRMMLRPVRRADIQPLGHISLDVREDDTAYIIHADLPGAKKEDVHVTVDGNHVNISAELKLGKEVREGETLLCRERHHGLAYRSFTLEHEIDEANAQAKYVDGVLELRLPKKTPVAGKMLEVK